ncbi:MAG: Na-K-Cl cotransporter [Candidatus Aminicenantes bacterium]|nr:Na-K-Cl cotransporter [Candidatus Aminicenantes bacterium]
MNPSNNKTLGTFLGVFTPTILTILGVIMYLRSGWLVGHLGLPKMILIVVLANTITLITTLSFSSVATNIKVGTGGAYYIISRSLGFEIGGAIGLPLFLSQTFSVTLYSYGLAESLQFIWPDVSVKWAAFLIVIAVGGLALTGAGVALKTQIPVMVFVGVSLVALTIGAISRASEGEIMRNAASSGGLSFWAGFAIFFPAVTGVMAGLGLSGDLRDPLRAIPRGAIMAVLVGFVIYLSLPVLLAIGADSSSLRGDTLIWFRIAPLGAVIIMPGLLGAIFSSAVGSILGAPRTLQALAKDRIVPSRLGKETGDWKELLPGLIVSVAIALGAVFLGNLNAVAAIVSMFFLTVYGTINLVAAFETLSGDSSWRPKLRIPWQISLLGGAGCVFAMFLISPVSGAIAVTAELLLWIFLSRRKKRECGDDVRRGLYEALIRWALIKLARRPMSARNWRPHILVFVPDPIDHLDLIRFGNWFSQGRGVVTVCELVVGDLMSEDLELENRRLKMQKILDEEELVVFAEVDAIQDVVEGITSVAQANGMGALQSNTVLLGWPNKIERITDFLKVMRRLETLNISLVIGRTQPRHIYRRKAIDRIIHIWWGGLQRNGDLMLLLAYLLKRNPEWRDAQIKIMSIASNEMMKEQTEKHLEELLPEIRIDAEPNVIIKPEDMSVFDLIHEESANAEVVFMGLASTEKGEEKAYAERLEKLAGRLPTVFFVKNSSLFVGELLESSTLKDTCNFSP